VAGSRQTRGDCVYCGRDMSRSGLARHLKTCPERLEVQAEADRSTRKKQTLYHLQVQDAWSGYYWLHLEMRGEATLQDLDRYLRAIWLECCGHLSEFEIGNTSYTQIFADSMAYRKEQPMSVKVYRLFRAGMEIPYRYDFGTTSELLIKVVDQREGRPTTAHPITLMARNTFEPPPCIECGQPATHLCTECFCERSAGACEFCKEHAMSHEHDEEVMPLLNSPRTGMCGYVGPAEPPY
jgi:hypothetical protein